MRHECEAKGTEAKCHICEDIKCGSSLDKICNYQLQGVKTSEMSKNIPSVSDIPFAVGGTHRYDFGNTATSHVCLHLSETCSSSYKVDYSSCELRCWGHGMTGADAKAEYHLESSSYALHAENSGAITVPWLDPKPSDVWDYPKSLPGEGPRNPNTNPALSYNPQGYVYTHSGSSDGSSGFKDGPASDARFKYPEDVAIDYEGYAYVADSGNHAIRMVAPDGSTTTIAGLTGESGSDDGGAATAKFSSPSGIAVWYDWQWWTKPDPSGDTDNVIWKNGNGTLNLFVADTGNHRIRKITGNVTVTPGGSKIWSDVQVSCFSGRCGNGTSSFTHSKSAADPRPGYADGHPDQSRFNGPRGIAVSDYGDVFVADTDNHLIRVLQRNGTARTLAGTVALAEEVGGEFFDGNNRPLPGCEPPCYYGVPGYADGNLTSAAFHFPQDIAMGFNNTDWDGIGTHVVYVTDKHRLRRVAFEVPTFDVNGKTEMAVSKMQGVWSSGRVSTIAGVLGEGQRDGQGDQSSFNSPQGVIVTADGIAYVVDSVSCRVRRVTPASQVAELATCASTVDSLIRPSGCSSYDPPVDELDLTATPSNGNTYNNYAMRDISDVEFGVDYIGRMIKDCVGSPPPDKLDKKYWNVTSATYPYNENLAIDDHQRNAREDPNEGTTIKIRCPKGCSPEPIFGGPYYTTYSSVCSSAVHAGVLTASEGGLVTVTLERGIQARIPANVAPSTANGITSSAITRTHTNRLFRVSAYPVSTVEVQTISGAPAAILESSCGREDAMPAQEAKFSTPSGIGAAINRSLTDTNHLYIADRDNHNIRALSAACSFVCENMGICVGPDKCQCKNGWEGADCSRPKCSTPCGNNELCIAPDTCDCIPGYQGASCDQATCVQTCENGGSCTAPDTCSCSNGWFDSNCTTPVCEQTCGNGGNCTSPNTCSCPTDWDGPDCRVPKCSQTCQNGGFCVAPDTCSCPPQYSGFDCSLPICHQGFFLPNPSFKEGGDPYVEKFWEEYKPCNVSDWCESTDTFDCLQNERVFRSLKVPYGSANRIKTGKVQPQPRCHTIELGENVISPFPYIRSGDQSLTSYHRYTPKTPYGHTSNPPQPHNNYVSATDQFTQPWKFKKDRQVALVELMNVTQGVYVCANGGNCTAPDTCVCAPGWVGFDCRTPVCNNGYYEPPDVQQKYVSGTNLPDELSSFLPFMGNNTYRLDPNYNDGEGYSNPNYTIWEEGFLNKTHMVRYYVNNKGVPYLSAGALGTKQGGYSCSVRSVTQWEGPDAPIFEHPNYYSRYMDRKVEGDDNIYSNWTGMEWPPLHYKSPKFEWGGGTLKMGQGTVQLNGVYSPDPVKVKQVNVDKNPVFYTYTDQGYRRDGDWGLTGNEWKKGTCVIEFNRTCSGGKVAIDLKNGLDVAKNGLFVQDTDISFRPRITYDDVKAYPSGRWFQDGGECVDRVIRGCMNNGTCVAPNVCECAEGWTGTDCTTPVCSQTCHHNGNCTLPNICTCEKGWTGDDCSEAVCAQECNNFGRCVAPDVCQCMQWPNNFYDGYEGGGRPLFRKPNGDPQLTGWTGYDCATPICVQAETFILNVDTSASNPALVSLGGHGKDGRFECNDVRCHIYNEMVTKNDGRSFQTGCGYDPIDTGCCDAIEEGERSDLVKYVCHRCREGSLVKTKNTISCTGMMIDSFEFVNDETMPPIFKPGESPKLCGREHNPGGPMGLDIDGKPTNVEYYVSYLAGVGPEYSSQNGLSNITSNSFLCNRYEWEQGDFVDDAGLGDPSEVGINSDFGLQMGRHIRINYPNYNKTDKVDERNNDIWMVGPPLPGEGIYACKNGGSCVGPDVCTCADGWASYDCSEPLCRHMQGSGDIVSCLNGGICSDKDDCTCIQDPSVLWKVHKGAKRGLTGWTGTDCSMPICVQGYYDPFCKSEWAPGGEGCYRCANGGMCTAPDYCECAPGWTGYDCKTPKCEVVSSFLIRKQLYTVDEEKIHKFENDPCSMSSIAENKPRMGSYRGNCTLPNTCTCTCYHAYSPFMCFSECAVICGGDEACIEKCNNGYTNELGQTLSRCAAPWQDLSMYRWRSVLQPFEMFGTRDCSDGYEGVLDASDKYMSCHMAIKVPSWFTANTFEILVFGTIFSIVFSSLYVYVRRRMKRRYILAKIERRKSRRSSEESVTGADANAFTY